MFYMYVYFTEKDASIPTYVGKGKGERMSAHPTAKSHFGNHIRKQLRADIFPLTVKLPQVSERAAFDEEIRLVALYGRKDLGTGPLYNKTDGGEGTSGRVITPEHREKYAAAHRGRKLSNEHRERISSGGTGVPRSHKGRPLSAERCAQISAAGLGKKHTEETKRKISAGNTGQLKSAEVRVKMSAAAKGRSNSPVAIAKMIETKRLKKLAKLNSKE